MKRPAKAAAPPATGLPSELREEAQQKLLEDYHGFVSNTSEEDPKHFIARSAAAREALEHLARLQSEAELPAEAEERTEDQLIADARADIAREAGP